MVYKCGKVLLAVEPEATKRGHHRTHTIPQKLADVQQQNYVCRIINVFFN